MSQLHFYEAGEGFPIVFLHGFCESSNIWKSLCKELSGEFKAVCPDLPGFGKSPLPTDDFSLEEIADIVAEWIQGRGIQQFIVVGHSLGGYIALELLRKYPDYIQGIGLLNSSAFEDSDAKKANRNKLISFISKNGVEPFLATFLPSLFYPKTIENHRSVIDELENDGKSIHSESVIKYAEAMRDRVDSTDLLSLYPYRVLLISGEYDQNVPLERSKKMASYLNDQNVHIVPDSAHMSLFEQSDLCYSAISQFVRKISVS